MAINLKFDLTGNPESPSIVLANRNGNKLGQLNVNVESIDVSDKFNAASEFSFTLNKYIDGEPTPLWDKVKDFKLVYCPEWDLWFEIKVELDEATETVKTVFCTQLGQAELSQIMLYNIEINTDTDIERDDYKTSILYDANNPKASILNRILDEKAPHYRIAHVDNTIANIQRSFSFDDISICDAFGEVEEEIGCLVVYESNADANRMPNRAISVYDLQQNCKGCGYRGEFTNQCPKCGSTNITYGYGEDTTIFVTSDELATEGTQLVTDVDSVKNCFKLEAGDDLMTATIRNCNPNGTDYIWYFSDSIKEDMSKELVDGIESYDEKYREHFDSKEYTLDENLVKKYNELVDLYDDDYKTKSTCLDCNNEGYFEEQCSNPKCNSKNILSGKRLQKISTTIQGYPNLMTAYYNTIDLLSYLKSSRMPNVEMNEIKIEDQIKLLETGFFSSVAVNVEDVKNVSLATANSAVLSMAKVIVHPTYKVEIKTETSTDPTAPSLPSLSDNLADDDSGKVIDKTWKGKFVLTNYSDEKDTAVTSDISIRVNNDTETFIKQKIEKALNKEDTDDYSITGLFANEIKLNADGEHIVDKDGNCQCDFCAELKKYALNPLDSFYKISDSCLSILTEQGAGNKDQKDLYDNLYMPYYRKSQAIAKEMKERENEIAIIEGVYGEGDEDKKSLVTAGLQTNIVDCQNAIQKELNFEECLKKASESIGRDLWLEFCAYRRDEKYSNSNYISDGLSNTELFQRALEFIEVAENEIFKSAELQHSISATLNNLLAIPKFKPLVDFFKVGNWIRVRVDDKIYKLRLLKYDISYGDLNTISVEFSDVVKIKNGTTDVQDILSQVSSMASSYDYVQKQASQGEKSNTILNNWIESGLNATNTKIVTTENQNQVWDKNGILCREYDPVTNTYSNEQLKIINSTIAITDNNWESTKTAIGKFYYKDSQTGELKVAYGVNGETIVGKLLIGEQLDVSNNSGDLTFGVDGLVVKNDKNTVSINPSDESIFNIKNDTGNIFSLNDEGELVIIGNITTSSLTLLDGTTIKAEGNITGLADVAISGDYNDLTNTPTEFITKDVDNLTNYYQKTEMDNFLASKVSTTDLADAGYLTEEGLDEAIDSALTKAKESGEFKGEDGISAEHSWNGTVLTITSATGSSSADLKPVRGTDYWTNDDKTEIVNAVLAELRNQGIIN